MYNFIEKINGSKDADTIDVYEALDMFLPGLFAYRSILSGGIPIQIPDLRDKNEREKWRNDVACTNEQIAGKDVIPSFHTGNPDIPEESYERQRKIFEADVIKKKTALTFKAGVDEYKDK